MSTKLKIGTEVLLKGNNYRWLGAQWARVGSRGKTTKMATKSASIKLTTQAIKKNVLKTKINKKDAGSSMKWFNDQIEKTTSKFKEVTKPRVGGMYTYGYDPKGKKTLPYYDKFPLIILVKPYKDGFLGLNVHYLSPANRDKFFTAMLKFTGKKDPALLTEKDLFDINWNKVAKVPLVEKTVHRYLFNHVKTKLVEIGPQEWEASIYLPTAKFKGASQKEVWSS